jgi:hypothetical protein
MLLQPRGQKGNFAIAVSDAHAFRWFGRGRDFEPNQGNHYQIEKVGRQRLKNLTAATDIYRIL